MKTLEYVKSHINEFEEDASLDRRWTKRFIDFVPVTEWERYGFKYTGEGNRKPKEWTEANIIEQMKKDVDFGFEKAVGERGISAELMAMVVNAWCKVLENGLNLDGNDGLYHIKQFRVVDHAYGWKLSEKWEGE